MSYECYFNTCPLRNFEPQDGVHKDKNRGSSPPGPWARAEGLWAECVEKKCEMEWFSPVTPGLGPALILAHVRRDARNINSQSAWQRYRALSREPLTLTLPPHNTCLSIYTCFAMPGEYETFENIYLDLSRVPGKCRFAASGMGWKANTSRAAAASKDKDQSTDLWTLVSNEFVQAQWSRASKGYELKVFTRTMGIVQLDGFEQDVSRFGLVYQRSRPRPGIDIRLPIGP